MSGFNIELNQASVRNFLAKAQEVEKVTQKSGRETVKYAFARFTIHGAGGAKPSKKKRKIVPNPERTRNRKAAKWLIIKYRQRKKVELIPTRTRRNRKRDIGRRGLAKASFGWMRKTFGWKQDKWASKYYRGFGSARRSRIGFSRDGTRKLVPEIVFHDRLGYLLEAYPNIGVRAMKIASQQMERYMRRWMNHKVKRIFS